MTELEKLAEIVQALNYCFEWKVACVPEIVKKDADDLHLCTAYLGIESNGELSVHINEHVPWEQPYKYNYPAKKALKFFVTK